MSCIRTRGILETSQNIRAASVKAVDINFPVKIRTFHTRSAVQSALADFILSYIVRAVDYAGYSP